MNKPTASDIRKSSSSGRPKRVDDRLVENFRVSKEMHPFVRRLRLRIEDFDFTDPARASQFASSREEMRTILSKKKISDARAKRAIALTLAAAVDHQLQSLRQNERHHDRVRSARDVRRLIARLKELLEAIAKLPPGSKKTLNSIIADRAEQFFDTETFAAIIQGIADALPKLAPERRALVALDVIDQPIAGVIRTSPPELIELWETMSAATRRGVEQAVRDSTAKKMSNQILAATHRLVGSVFAAGNSDVCRQSNDVTSNRSPKFGKRSD
jgi:hypothetical protein